MGAGRILAAGLLAGLCVACGTPSADQRAAAQFEAQCKARDAATAASEARDAAQLALFDATAKHTADGSRAYEYLWSTGWGSTSAGHHLILLVRPDGGAVLYGAARQAAPISAEAAAPFEAAVARAGFPNLPSAARVLCNDGQMFPEVFTAAIGGHQAKAFGDACGQVAIPLDKAVGLLQALADANGGLEPRHGGISCVPVRVRALMATHAPPIAP